MIASNFTEVIGFTFETSGSNRTKQRYLPGISMKSNNKVILGDQCMVASTADEQDRKNLCHPRGLHDNSEQMY